MTARTPPFDGGAQQGAEAAHGLTIPKERLLFVVAVLVYVVTFHWTYLTLVAPVYDGWGNGYRELPVTALVFMYGAAVIPSVWIPTRFHRPSLLFYYVQFFVLYVPCCFIAFYASLPRLGLADAFSLVGLLFAGLAVMQLAYSVPPAQFALPTFSPRLFWGAFGAVGMALVAYVVVRLGGNFRLADLEAIYEVRAAAEELILSTGSRIGAYAQGWLAGFVLPFLFAVGAFTRRWALMGLAAAGYVLLFGVGGSKTTLFSMIYVPGVFLLLRAARRSVATGLALGLSGLLAAGVGIAAVAPGLLGRWYVAVVHFRTFSVPALLIVQYREFFRHNPLTYLSHVSGINRLIHYPYDFDIPRIVGLYYYNLPIGANAGPWAGDGIAGFGPAGIILMSGLCALFFWVLDSVSVRFNPRFVAVACTFAITSFANVPLSTSLLSGGLLFLMLAFAVAPLRGVLAPLGSDSRSG